MSRLGWVWCGLGVWVAALGVTSCGESRPPEEPPATDGGAASGAAGEVAAPQMAGNASVWLSESPPPDLGKPCKVDAECGEAGLTCLTGEQDYMDGAGAPAGGLCTAECAIDDDCRGFDDEAVCVTLAESPLVREYATKRVERLCMLGCSLGAPAGSTKCHGRRDLACRPFAPVNVQQCGEDESCPDGTFCYRDRCRELACGPRCNDDSECAPGRACDATTGLCTEDLVQRVPVGRACDGDLPNGIACGDGLCLVLFDEEGFRVKGMCTQSCTLGYPCAGGTGACVTARFTSYAVGDIAYCQALCNDDEDCENPVDRCFPWDDAITERHYGSRGRCDYAPEGSLTPKE
jgi:hypothetical protein